VSFVGSEGLERKTYDRRRPMSKLLYSATMSLDGFIAGPNGDMSWLTEHLVPSSSPEIEDLMENIGALLVGRRTWSGDDPTRAPTRRARSAGPGMGRPSC